MRSHRMIEGYTGLFLRVLSMHNAMVQVCFLTLCVVISFFVAQGGVETHAFEITKDSKRSTICTPSKIISV